VAIVAVEGVRRGERCGARGTFPVRAASERAGTVRSTVPVRVWRAEPAPAQRNAWGDKTLQATDVHHVRRGSNASRGFEDPTVSNRAGYFLTDRTRTSLSSDRSTPWSVDSRSDQTQSLSFFSSTPLLRARNHRRRGETESAARGARAASRDLKRAQNVTMKIEEVQSTTKKQRVATHTHIKVSPATIASAIGTSDPRTGTLIIDFDLLRIDPDRSTTRRVKRAHV